MYTYDELFSLPLQKKSPLIRKFHLHINLWYSYDKQTFIFIKRHSGQKKIIKRHDIYKIIFITLDIYAP